MGFKLFVSEVRSLSEVAVRRSNEFLSPLNLSLSIDWEYDSWENIYDGNAIGVYEADSVFGGEIVIGFNLRNLYKAFNRMVKDYPFSDPYTMLDEMIQTNVYHEMGHGIVQLFNDYLQESDDLDELYDNNREVFDSVLDDEEDAVERFAWSFYDNQLNESELYQIIRLYLDNYNIKTEGINMNKKQVIRLTEGDLHRIVKESVKRVLSEGFYDPDDDNEIFDIGKTNTYKVSWEIKARGNTPYTYNTIDDGEKIVHSKDEAYNIFNQIKEKHKGQYATELRIEQLIKTYSDNRWENVYDASHGVIE